MFALALIVEWSSVVTHCESFELSSAILPGLDFATLTEIGSACIGRSQQLIEIHLDDLVLSIIFRRQSFTNLKEEHFSECRLNQDSSSL